MTVDDPFPFVRVLRSYHTMKKCNYQENLRTKRTYVLKDVLINGNLYCSLKGK